MIFLTVCLDCFQKCLISGRHGLQIRSGKNQVGAAPAAGLRHQTTAFGRKNKSRPWLSGIIAGSLISSLRFFLLAYPEIIPKDLHHICLYTDFDQLVAKLCHVLANPAGYDSCRRQLALYMGQHAWQRRISAFDQEIKLAAG
jgi:hypothetical protein